MALAANKRELAKPLAGLVFVAFWIIAIVLWVITGSGLITDDATRGFLIDIGIVLASIGFAAPFLPYVSSLRTAFLFGLLAIVAFALGSYLDATAVVYALRMLVPFFALQAPVAKLVGSVHVFS
jgi:hypothetical protein